MNYDGMVEVRNLWKDYGPLHALADVSFSVGKGEVFGLLGRNGSGKTTLLRILTGYRLPTAGSVEVAGFDLLKKPLAVRRRIGYMPEHPQLYPDLTVRGFLRFVANTRGMAKDQGEARIDQLTSHFALGAVIDRLGGHCSKGYRARISLAAAVLHRPDVVFLDEPTDGLDPEQRLLTHQLIRELTKESTVILCSHDLDEVGVLCSRALVLDRGRVSTIGSIEELGGTAGIAEVFRNTRERDRGVEK